MDPILIHKHALKCSPVPYFLRNLLYKVVIVAGGLLTWFVCGLVPLEGLPGFLVRGCLCVILPSIVFAGCFFRTTEFRFLLDSAASLLPKGKRQGDGQ